MATPAFDADQVRTDSLANDDVPMSRSAAKQPPTYGIELADAPPGRTQLPAASVPSPELSFEQVLVSIRVELAELEPMIARLSTGVPADPADYALNDLRNLDLRLRGDADAVHEFAAVAPTRSGELQMAVSRFQALRMMLAPAVVTASAWHEAHPAGESLGMMNERHGTWLAGAGAEQWDKGGLHTVPGVLAYVGAAGVATIDAVEKVASMGFHETSTAVAEAYARGAISWNEGNRILAAGASRAILTAALSKGVGGLAGRLGAAGAATAGLATDSLGYGIVSRAVGGGISAAVGLGTQTLLTKVLQDWFASPAAKAIWRQGMPRGKDWLLAITVAAILGGLGGARGVEVANENLVGSVVDTPDGPMTVVAVVRDGLGKPNVLVLRPVGASLTTALAPPMNAVSTFDPLANSWKAISPNEATTPSGSSLPAVRAPSLPSPLDGARSNVAGNLQPPRLLPASSSAASTEEALGARADDRLFPGLTDAEIDAAFRNLRLGGDFVQVGETYHNERAMRALENDSARQAAAMRATPEMQKKMAEVEAMKQRHVDRPPTDGDVEPHGPRNKPVGATAPELESAVTKGKQGLKSQGVSGKRPSVYGTLLHAELRRIAQAELGRKLAPDTEFFNDAMLKDIVSMSPPDAAMTVGDWLKSRNLSDPGLGEEVLDQPIGDMKPDLAFREPGRAAQVIDLTGQPTPRHLAKTLLYGWVLSLQ